MRLFLVLFMQAHFLSQTECNIMHRKVNFVTAMLLVLNLFRGIYF